MKNRNPYLSCMILWICAICFCLTACILGIVVNNLLQALLNLAVVIFDCIYLGWTICKFNAYRDFIKSAKELEKDLKKIQELMKMKDDEPFKEFESGKDN